MIDLKKIPARELPKKTIKVNILGILQEQEIQPLTGEGGAKYWATTYGEDNTENTWQRIRIALIYGANLDEDVANELIRLDWQAALSITTDVHMFTQEFNSAIQKEKLEAEKNSIPQGGTDIPS